ncbi:uncharacterized protein LOC102805396, partial [Saccoglossus kowalevskii]|uniref:Uncharacterized protein LOC102805396 n=1 Tax=Saccoglossus kowalevskii TaxID=10224 RepID=A0ABM0MP70_SACKO
MDKTAKALGWMRFRFERIGDFMPHKEKIYLPVFYNATMLYDRMKRELAERLWSETDVICYSYFRAVWLKFLPEFVIEQRTEFSVCGDCVQITEALEQATSEAERNAIRKTKHQHEHLISTERNFYHTAREMAVREPEELTCIIQDGMDQKKTNVPKLSKNDKNTEHLLRVPMHATGCLFHTNVPEGKIASVRLDINQFPHDSNMTMNNFLWTLEDNVDRLGRNLHAQFDN